MLCSAASGKFVIAEKAVRSAVSGKVGLPDEMVQCAWLDQPVLRDEVKTCKLTQQVVAATFLNARQELIPLRDLLDGRSREAVGADDLIPRIRSLSEAVFRGLKHVWAVWSPGRRKRAVCGEVSSWFGMKVRYVGFLLDAEPASRAAGQGVLGYRGKDGWKQEETVEFR